MATFWGTALMVIVLAVVFVNGWTDAPNAIASAVATKALSFPNAVRLAAACNLLGLLLMSLVSVSVADTITTMVDFGTVSLIQSQAALCAAMAAIVLFAVAAWYFGIPTSESHALLAALAGASIATGGRGPFPATWGLILAGLVLSLSAGFLSGFLLTKWLAEPLSRLRPKTLDRLQILSAGAMAFMHGAQDGQKFAAVLIAASFMAMGLGTGQPIAIQDHIGIFILCGVVMALGTAVGGKRIVVSVGMKMVHIRKHQGVCADLGSALCLAAASLAGIPVSTTHTKTTALMGAGAAGEGGSDRSIIRSMLFAWAFTFPVCGAMGFLLTRLFLGFV